MVRASLSHLTSSHPGCLGSEPALPARVQCTRRMLDLQNDFRLTFHSILHSPIPFSDGAPSFCGHLAHIFSFPSTSLTYTSRLFVPVMYDIGVCSTYGVCLEVLSCISLTSLSCLSIVMLCYLSSSCFASVSTLLRTRTDSYIACISPVDIASHRSFYV